MLWMTALGGVIKAGFGWLGAKEAGKRAERGEQLKMILASERARTTKRSVLGWVFVTITLSFIIGDLYYTGGLNVEVLLQIFAMSLAQ